MLRSALIVLLLFTAAAAAQDSASNSEPPAGALAAVSAPQAVSAQVQEAEAAIGKSDWKAAEAILDPWLVAHPTDARALFDAGYVADAQNRLDDAAALYRRAVEADPKSFEAHLSLGLLLARQGKFDEARPELGAATTARPRRRGTRRQSPRLARPGPDRPPHRYRRGLQRPASRPLSYRPKPRTIPCWPPAWPKPAGQYDAAEAAYRRVLAKDPIPPPPTPAWPTC